MAYGFAARLGAGITPSQMHAETIDGYNPLAVIDAYRRKRKIIEDKQGPVLLEVLTYRMSGHSPSDADSYRSKEEKEMWAQQDSIVNFTKQMLKAGITTENEIQQIVMQAKTDIEMALKLSIDDQLSPRIDLNKNPNAIGDLMFSDQNVKSLEEGRTPDVLIPKEDNPRLSRLKTKVRYACDQNGKEVSKAKLYQLRDGIFEAMLDKFYEDPTMVAYGEENRDWGGAFAVYRGLTESLPYHRLFNTPISEGAIVGTGVGYAMCGGRAVVELMYSDFLGRAGDEVFNQMSKWQAMSAGVLKMPLVLRMSVGSKYGAQHSQDWSALCTHVPGSK